MDAPYTIERYHNERDWLQARQLGCGSSDAAAVAGLGRDRGMYSTWAGKTSPVVIEPKDDIVLFGHLHEPVIAAEFERRAKLPEIIVTDPGEYTLFRSKAASWNFCTPDRLLQLGPDLYAVLELKTAYFDQAKIWAHRVPLSYIVQMNWQMHVLGVSQGYVAVLMDGYRFAWHPVRRNEKLIQRLIQKVDHFWANHVLPDVAPAPDATAATSRALASLYAVAEPVVADLPEALDEVGAHYDTLSDIAKKCDERKRLIRNFVQAEMKEAEYGQLLDGSGFRWSGSDGKRRFTRVKKVKVPDEN